MKQTTSRAAVGLAFVILLASRATADKKQLRYSVQPAASLNLVSDFGAVHIRSGPPGEIVVNATPASSKVRIEGIQNRNRIDVRSQYASNVTDADGRADYDIEVPADTHVVVRTSSGSVQVQGINADIVVDTDNGEVKVRDAHGHVKVRTVGGPITLTALQDGFIDATSISGQVALNDVTGKSVTVNTTSAPIRYTGDFSGAGMYSFSSHSGAIEVSLPASASVDVSARSVTGDVQNDFQFTPAAQSSMALVQGKSLAGTLNSGASSLHLRTFSGRIRVKKQ